MSGRTGFMDLGDVFTNMTEKEGEALIAIHPYLDGLSQREAAEELGISRDALQQRLKNIYQKIPWLREDIAKKRTGEAQKRRNLSRPMRFGDMSGIESDGDDEYFYGDKIVRKF